MSEIEFHIARRPQSILSGAFLLLVLLTCLGADLLARSQSLDWWMTARSSEFAAKNNTVFSNTGSFIDFEERVLLDEIPNTDFAKGGTYFFGSSNTKWAFSSWDLSPEKQRQLRNYGIGASNHKDQLEFIRFLIEHNGFLKGGGRDTVVLGVSFHLAHTDGPSGGYWAALLRRRGLYEITDTGAIEPTALSPVARWLRVEQARSSGVIWNLGRLAQAAAKSYLAAPKLVNHDPVKYQSGWREFMGPGWQQNINEAMTSLKQTIDLVRSHGAAIKLVLLPQGSWMNSLPYGAYYGAAIRRVSTEMGVPLIDLSQSLADEDFVDSNHLTVLGQRKFRDIMAKAVPGTKR